MANAWCRGWFCTVGKKWHLCFFFFFVATLSIGGEITEESVNQVVGKFHQRLSTHIVHAEDIIGATCDFYNVKPTQLRGPKREASLVKARQITMYLLKKELGLTLVEIGNLLGGRDHTTIMHGVDKVALLVEKKGVVFEEIVGIKEKVRG